MGHDLGFGCETCGFDNEGRVKEYVIIDNWRRHQDQLMGMIDQTPNLILARKALKDSDFKIVGKNTYYNLEDAVDFLIAHNGHKIRVCLDYLRFVDECYKTVTCNHCTAYRYCVKPYNHEGACSSDRFPNDPPSQSF